MTIDELGCRSRGFDYLTHHIVQTSHDGPATACQGIEFVFPILRNIVVLLQGSDVKKQMAGLDVQFLTDLRKTMALIGEHAKHPYPQGIR